MDKSDNSHVDRSAGPQTQARPRPFWIIGHRCNNEGDIAKALSDGANAVEFDVTSDGDSFIVKHPGPDLHVPTIDQYVKALNAERERLTFFYVDYKGPDFTPQACERLASKVRDLCVGARIKALFSTSSLENKAWFGGLPKEPWVAPQLDENNDPAEVERFFQSSSFARSWYSDGSIALLPEPDRVEKNIRDAIQIRGRGGSVTKGVAVWTLDQKHSMRKYLDLGVDAILSNDPDDLAAVLGEADYIARYHKATKDDLPW